MIMLGYHRQISAEELMEVNERLPQKHRSRFKVGRVADEVTTHSHNGTATNKTEVEAEEMPQAGGSDRECPEMTSLLAEPHVRAIVCVYGVFSVSGTLFVVFIAKELFCASPWHSAGRPIVTTGRSMLGVIFLSAVDRLSHSAHQYMSVSIKSSLLLYSAVLKNALAHEKQIHGSLAKFHIHS